MKCPECQNELVSSAVGTICLNCGHLEEAAHAEAKPVPAEETAAPAVVPPPPPAEPKIEKFNTPPAAAAVQPPGDTPPAGPVGEAVSRPMPAAPIVTPQPALPPQPAAAMAPPPAAQPVQATPAAATPLVARVTHVEPLTDEPAKNRHKLHPGFFLAAGIGVVVVVLMGLYLYYLAPRQALANYFSKFSDAQTGTIKAVLSFDSEDRDYSSFMSDISLDGSYDVSNPDDLRFQLTATGEFDSGGELEVESRIVTDNLYIRFGKFDILSAFLGEGASLPPVWLRMPLEKGDGDCSFGDFKEYRQALSDLPVREVSRSGLYERLEGRTVAHYKGVVDTARLPEFVNSLQDKLPEGCSVEHAEAGDYDQLEIHYELWSASDFDRLKLTIADSETMSSFGLVLDTAGYNRPVNIEAPVESHDFMEFFALLSGSSSPQNQMKARDAQRKSDLRNLKTALETYYNDFQRYPSSLLSLQPAYIKSLPTDPKTGEPYEYILGEKAGSYLLRAKFENFSDPDANDSGYYEVKSANGYVPQVT